MVWPLSHSIVFLSLAMILTVRTCSIRNSVVLGRFVCLGGSIVILVISIHALVLMIVVVRVICSVSRMYTIWISLSPVAAIVTSLYLRLDMRRLIFGIMTHLVNIWGFVSLVHVIVAWLILFLQIVASHTISSSFIDIMLIVAALVISSIAITLLIALVFVLVVAIALVILVSILVLSILLRGIVMRWMMILRICIVLLTARKLFVLLLLVIRIILRFLLSH